MSVFFNRIPKLLLNVSPLYSKCCLVCARIPAELVPNLLDCFRACNKTLFGACYACIRLHFTHDGLQALEVCCELIHLPGNLDCSLLGILYVADVRHEPLAGQYAERDDANRTAGYGKGVGHDVDEEILSAKIRKGTRAR
jgi:hypothetical protein